MRRLAAAAMAAAVLPALGLSACAEKGHRPEAAAPVAATGERLVLTAVIAPELKPAAATVTSRDMGEARARIGGTLTRLLVREGDYVREGQLIGLVTDQRLKFETTAYSAQVAAAAAEAERARADLARVRTLFDKGFYAKARLDQAEAAARAAQAQLDATRAMRAASAELADQGAILAPTSGRVIRADAPAGSVVAPGQSIATITAGDAVLRLEVPEAQARALRVGDRLPLVAEDLPGTPDSAVITQIYPAVNAGRVVADLSVPGLNSALVGQRVRVRVRVGERPALLVPLRFVSTRFGVDFVRVVGPGGRAADVAVQLAPGPDAGQVEILSGAAAGDVLVAFRSGR